MRQSTYKILSFILLFIWSASSIQAKSVDEDFAKIIEKSFSIAADGKVELKNKYGDMKVKTWNQNKVDIHITIEVSAKSEAKAEDIFKLIKINFQNESDFVSAITELNSDKLKMKRGDQFKINYIVHMPASCFLDATAKYGDMAIESLNNGAKLKVAYGALYAERIQGETDLILSYAKSASIDYIDVLKANIKFSELSIDEMNSGKIESQYSEVSIDVANQLEIMSKYDEYSIDKVTELINEGRYDEFSIDEVSIIDVNTQFTDFEIDVLSKKGKIDIRYGAFVIEELSPGFDELEIEAEYAAVEVATEGGVRLNYEGSYAELDLPSDFKVENKEEFKHGIVKHLDGSIGEQNDSGLIDVKLKFGAFVLEQ